MANPDRLKLLFSLLFFSILVPNLHAQEESYGFTFAPDLWYNDVDGSRIGIRVLGEVNGTFKDGPHRVDVGIWLGTWLPKNPISYYASLTEPIAAISDFGSEGNIQFISSVRTGYSQHRIQFNKRWQQGFDEYSYKELALYFSQEKLIDDEYHPYSLLWHNQQKSLFGFNFKVSDSHDIGHFFAYAKLKQNINEESGSFTVGTIELQQRFNISARFKFRLRGFAGFTSDDATPEYRFMSSMAPAQDWIDNGISRAKGTIPMPWLNAGSFHVGGGANIRGYLNRDIRILNSLPDSEGLVVFPLFKSIWSLNSEFDFPNPINKRVKKINIIGDLVNLRSYLFFDIGKGTDYSTYVFSFSNTVTPTEGVHNPSKIIANTGTGVQLSVNIPDYLGKDRGVFIRYEVPFWLSDVSDSESNFSFRQLIGFGAIFSF